MIKYRKRLLLLFLVVFAGFALAACTEAEVITGPQGPAGAVGPAGPVGPAGVVGEDGEDGVAGKSAYDLYKDLYPGYEGTAQEWLVDLATNNLVLNFEVNLGGGSYSPFDKPDYVPGEVYQVMNGEVVELEEPFKDLHTFIGWYTGDVVLTVGQDPVPTYIEKIDLSEPITEDTVVYARFIKTSSLLPANNSIASALDPLTTGAVSVRGVVTSIISNRGFFIEENILAANGTTVLSNKSILIDNQARTNSHIKVGDEVIVEGTKGSFSGIVQVAVGNAKDSSKRIFVANEQYNLVVPTTKTAAQFLEAHKVVLALVAVPTEDKTLVVVGNLGIINNALADFKLLSYDVRTELSAEKLLLDRLLAKIKVPTPVTDVSAFVSNAAFETLVGKPVKLGTEAAPYTITGKWNNPSLQSGTVLADGEFAFNLTLTHPTEDFTIQIRIDSRQLPQYKYLALYAWNLFKVGDTVYVNGGILSWFNGPQIIITAESQLILVEDGLSVEFKADHAAALALKVEEVVLADEAIIDAALADFELLPNRIQLLLSEEEAHLLALLAKITPAE